MQVFKIALRNVIRRKLQTIALGAMMGLTTFAIFAMVGVQTGAFRLLEDSYTQVFNGDIQVRNVAYEELDDFEDMLSNSDVAGIQTVLKNFKKTKVYFAKRYINFGLADVNDRNYSFQLIGIEPQLEKNISIVSKKMVVGTFLDNKNPNNIIIGQELADFLKVKVGDEMTIMTTDIYDSFVIDAFKVQGIYKIGDDLMDKSSVFISKKYFDDNVVYDANHMTNITIKLQDPSYRSELKKLLKAKANKVTNVLSWDEILPEIQQVIEFEFSVSMVFYFTLAIIVAFTLLNSMMLATIKRAPEFGILSAMGLDASYLKWILIFENAILATCFVLLGTMLGMAFVLYFSKAGIPLPSLAESADKPLTLIDNILYPNPRNPLLLFGPLIIFSSCMLSVIPPVLRLRKLNPVQSLTYI